MKKHKLLKTILLSLMMVLFFPCFVSATDYIVPLDMDLVQPSTFPGIGSGDRLLLEPGVRERLQLKSLNGEQDNPIIVINNGGVVDVNATWVGIWLRNCEHIRVTGTGDIGIEYGIKIRDGTNIGIFGQEKTRYIEFDHLEIFNVGIGVSANTRDDIYNNIIPRDTWVQYETSVHDCYIHDVTGEGIYLGSSYWLKTFYDENNNSYQHPELNGVYVYDNMIDSPGYECIQVGSAPNNVEVHNNACTNAGWSDEGNPPTGANCQTGMMVGKGTTGKWYNNKIINPGRHGIYIQGVGGYDFFNNVIVNTGSNVGVGQGIIWRGSSQGSFYNNNIINSVEDGIYVASYINDGLIYDNIIAGYGDVAIRNNNVNKYNNIETSDISSVGFVDSSNNDFHLQATSIAIDNGSNSGYPSFDFDGNPRPQGSAPDIGAFEYLQSTPTCQLQGYQCCDSCESGAHPEYDANCPDQVCCDSCYVPTSSSLANSTTMSSSSNNFALDHPVEHLWDKCVESTPECTSGAGNIASFWVEFDFGQNYNLNLTRLFGDADGNWVSRNWSLFYKLNAGDSWTPAFTGVNTLFNNWVAQNLDITARYVKVEVIGNPDIPATQARELEIYGVVCAENWDCTLWSDWSECIGNQQSRTRTCTDLNNCGTETNKPAETETRECESPITYGILNFIQLVSDWLKTETGLDSDVNNDGIVNTRDLGIMMSNWQN